MKNIEEARVLIVNEQWVVEGARVLGFLRSMLHEIIEQGRPRLQVRQLV